MSAAGSHARGGALLQLLEELSRRAHAFKLFVSVESLRQLGEGLLERRSRRTWSTAEEGSWPLAPQLERELHAAHARRQADLLRAALELRLASSLEGRWWTAPSLTPPDWASWIAAAGAAVDDALADDADLDAELLACCLQRPEEWSSAPVLAAASAELDPGWRGRLALLRAELLEEPLGRECFEQFLAEGLPLAERARVLHLAGLSAERRGDLHRALDASLASALLMPEPRAALMAWVLASELGERGAEEDAWRILSETSRPGESQQVGLRAYLWRELQARREQGAGSLADELRRRCEGVWLAASQAAEGIA